MFGQILDFFMQHSDLIDLLIEAINKGLSKQTLIDAIKTAMVEAANAEMKAEFPKG